VLKRAGARVAGVDADPSTAQIEPCYAGDLTDESSVRALFDRLSADGGLPEVVVHTVGMWDGRPFEDTDLEQWRLAMDVNLTTTFLVFREAVRRHRQNGAADRTLRLIAFGSGQGADRGRGQQAAYSAAKAGVIRLVEALADEYSEQDVTAHAIAPSMILFEGMEDEKGIPAEDLANLCALLAGPAGDALNGAVIRAYGTLV
jgi:NAD(P)-dependent dehydrogenase (short-subunit alcohol dehydrogenase family)